MTNTELSIAISEELIVNKADVGFTAEEIAETVVKWAGLTESYLTHWISYGKSANHGVSLQVAIVLKDVLFDFEFVGKKQHIFVIAIAKIETMLAESGPLADGDVWSSNMEITAGDREAVYEAVGDKKRAERLLSFYQILVTEWRSLNG